MSIKQDNQPAGPKPPSFAETHCRNCAAGWTRIGAEGGFLTVCLLDREPVWADMTGCDRYEPRAETEA